MNTRSLSLSLLSGLCAGMPTPAAAQSFANGGLQTGSMSGWSVVNTSNGTGAPGSVTSIDIDGPGPLGANFAARFAAGQATSQPGVPHGVELTQNLSLVAGTEYLVDFDWSAQRFSGSNVLDAGRFALIVGGAVIVQGSAGVTSPTTPRYGHVTGSFTPTLTGSVSVGIRITRPFTPAPDLFQFVDNVTISVAPPASTPLGALPVGPTTASGTLGPGEVRWYTFTIPAVASPAYLDIDTEGSTLAPGNDTELALYTATGVWVTNDDNDGSGNLSQLTFGNSSPRPAVGSGLPYNGRDGALPAGTYYLAVAGFNSTFGATNWSVASASANTGTFQVKLTLGNQVPTGACCTPAGACSIFTQVACSTATGVYRGDGTDCATPCPPPAACCLPTGGCSILSFAQCAAAGGVYSGAGSVCATANCPTVLFDSGRPCNATFNGSQTLVSFSSGSVISQGFPHRWEAQAFTLTQASRIRSINVDGFVPVGSEFTTMNFIVWRRTGSNRPVDQVVTGAVPLPAPAPDPRIPNSPLYLVSLPVDFNLAAGDYYLTIYASDAVNPGGDANFGWLTNAQQDPAHPGAPNTPIVVSDGQGVFMWRSATMPSPGFERFTLSTLSVATTPTYGPNPQSPDYLYNTAFIILGAVLPNTCYPNCDGSTLSPILNVNDFSCFLNRYAASDPYANCDASTASPVLNVNDFSCFLNRYAAGCP